LLDRAEQALRDPAIFARSRGAISAPIAGCDGRHARCKLRRATATKTVAEDKGDRHA
jgi:hypothetical protein